MIGAEGFRSQTPFASFIDVVVRRVAVDVVVRERGDDVEAAVLVLVGGVGLRLPPRGVGVEAVVEGARGRRAAARSAGCRRSCLRPLRSRSSETLGPIAGGVSGEPDAVELGVHHGEERLDAVARRLEVTALAVRSTLTSHIEPVRSRMSMMSSGFTEQGKHAVAFAVTGQRVHTDDAGEERRHLGGGRDGDGVHRRIARVAAGDRGDAARDRGGRRVSTVLTAFLLPGVGLYSVAVAARPSRREAPARRRARLRRRLPGAGAARAARGRCRRRARQRRA